jgi:hypothetical protein
MPWPIAVECPIVAIPGLHGQRASPGRLLARLGQLPEWARCAVDYLGVGVEADARAHDHRAHTDDRLRSGVRGQGGGGTGRQARGGGDGQRRADPAGGTAPVGGGG